MAEEIANPTNEAPQPIANEAVAAPAENAIPPKRRKKTGIIGLMAVLLVVVLGSVLDLTPPGDIAGIATNLYDNFLYVLEESTSFSWHDQANLTCSSYLNASALFLRIQDQHILHQEEALQLLEQALQQISNFTAIAVAGPSGVGKSLWANALMEHFPWPENVHSYDWSTVVEDEVEKFRVVRLFLENLSDCGRNLLIFDGLRPCDRELVNIVNKIVRHGEGYGNFNDKRVIVIYIFRLDSSEVNGELYKFQLEMLQYLRDTKTVQFKSFDQEEAEGCIRREIKVANLTLSIEDFDTIMGTVDAKSEGCKAIRPNVLKYGVPKS